MKKKLWNGKGNPVTKGRDDKSQNIRFHCLARQRNTVCIRTPHSNEGLPQRGALTLSSRGPILEASIWV
jgi:hypothetical protein